MLFTSSALTAVVALLGAMPAMAHMEMADPIPFRSKLNKEAPEGSYDYSMTAPLAPDGSNYPCKGYHTDFGTDAGKPTKSYQPGEKSTVKLAGSAFHNGGSCQLSLSYDKGETFKVFKSFLGNCPTGPDATLDFTVPTDAPAGDAIFAWTWFNKSGNREMYMNCAAVTIGGAPQKRRLHPKRSFSNAPNLFIANVGDKGNGCATTEGTDVEFPNPGDDVSKADGATLGPPTGSCGSGPGAGGAKDGEKPADGEKKPADAEQKPEGDKPAPEGEKPAAEGETKAPEGEGEKQKPADPAAPATSGAPGAPPAPGAPEAAPAPGAPAPGTSGAPAGKKCKRKAKRAHRI